MSRPGSEGFVQTDLAGAQISQTCRIWKNATRPMRIRTLVALFVLVTPREAFVSVVIVVGLLLAGGLFFLVMLKVDRQALETEPGDVSL
jgi:hypothetical protein